ncbi:MAG TPA: sigma-70 family RNA polymerase sigma factor [Burkholderiaceae bacterium]|nr:sigma-70 family RNA polymerase sigma factor [Burkholderiaceae bacterium]
MHDIDADRRVTASGFEPQRQYLLGLAYRMTGSWSDAEDVVQDAWLRWQAVAQDEVKSPRAFLSQTVTRLCLDLFKSARARREEYVGTWLPEPLPTTWDDGDYGTDALSHDLSMAFMLTLERLSPLERAAFLLSDVFDLPFRDIAQTLHRSEAACRQLAARARKRVREERPRYRVDEQEGLRIAEAFLRASRDGHVEQLRTLLAEDAVLETDGGGKKLATLRPILGADKIARFFAGIAVKEGGSIQEARVTQLNDMPAIVLKEADGLPRTISLDIQEDKIVAIYIVRNPDKLRHIQRLFE